jgi:hypothetical protein
MALIAPQGSLAGGPCPSCGGAGGRITICMRGKAGEDYWLACASGCGFCLSGAGSVREIASMWDSYPPAPTDGKTELPSRNGPYSEAAYVRVPVTEGWPGEVWNGIRFDGERVMDANGSL